MNKTVTDKTNVTMLRHITGRKKTVISRSLLGGSEHQITHANVDIELNGV